MDRCADTVKFDLTDNFLVVPHMSWNKVTFINQETLFRHLDGSHFFFVYTCHMNCENDIYALATANYGQDFILHYLVRIIFMVLNSILKKSYIGDVIIQKFWRAVMLQKESSPAYCCIKVVYIKHYSLKNYICWGFN